MKESLTRIAYPNPHATKETNSRQFLKTMFKISTFLYT
jgi:hypothetical protein